MILVRYILIATVLMVGYCVLLFCLESPVFWVIPAVGLLFLVRRKAVEFTSYGTARWASHAEMGHLLAGDGIILGHIAGKVSRMDGLRALFNRSLSARKAVETFLTAWQRKQPPLLVRLTDAVHTMVVAPTGVGKGVSIVIPHLLTCPDSMVVIDPKRENFQITCDARKRMGHRVVVLDPMGEGDTFNVLQDIDPDSPTALDEIRALTEALIVKTGHETEQHWNASAEVLLTGAIAATVAFAESAEKNLQTVRSILTNKEKFQAIIKMMCASDKFGGMLARKGGEMSMFEGKELQSVLTTTNRNLNFLDTIAVANITRTSSFDPMELTKGRGMTIYLTVTPEHQRALAPLMRLWITSLLRVAVKAGQSRRKIHYVLDEAATLGHLEVLEDAVDKYRSYGVRLLLIYQSLGQLKLAWPDGRDQTVLSNVSKVFFGVSEYATADFVSQNLGEFTNVVSSGGTNTGASYQGSDKGGNRSYSSGTNEGWSQAARRLLQPSEVMNLDSRVAIVFHPGVRPFWTSLVRYYERGWAAEYRIGFFKAVFDTACFFTPALLISVALTLRIFGNF